MVLDTEGRQIGETVGVSGAIKRKLNAAVMSLCLGRVVFLAGCTSVSLPPGAIGNVGK
jgi:hypothetical protein